MKRLITLFSILCALVCAVACSSSSSPSSVVEEQLKCMKSGEYEKMADLFYFEEGKEEESRKMIKSLGSKLAPKIAEQGGITSYKIKSEKISESGDRAEVEVTISYGDGTSDDESFGTVMHDGKWYLQFGK